MFGWRGLGLGDVVRLFSWLGNGSCKSSNNPTTSRVCSSNPHSPDRESAKHQKLNARNRHSAAKGDGDADEEWRSPSSERDLHWNCHSGNSCQHLFHTSDRQVASSEDKHVSYPTPIRFTPRPIHLYETVLNLQLLVYIYIISQRLRSSHIPNQKRHQSLKQSSKPLHQQPAPTPISKTEANK